MQTTETLSTSMRRFAAAAVVCAVAGAAAGGASAQTVLTPSAESAGVIDLGAAQAGGGGSTAPVSQRGAGAAGSTPTPLSLGDIQDKWADILQPSPDPLLRVPDDGRIYAIRIRTSMESLFISPAEDPIADFYLADAPVFEAGFSARRPNVLRIRALNTEADTTLHVITRSGRFFHFYLEARGPDFAEVPNVAVYMGIGAATRADFPDAPTGAAELEGGALGLEDAVRSALASHRAPSLEGQGEGGGTTPNVVTAPDYLRDIPFDPRAMRFDDYTVYIQTEESREIAPVNVMHDGITTYLYFGEKSDYIEHPTIRQVVDGIDTPVTYNVIGEQSDIYAVHAIGGFTLRVGGKIVCVTYTGPDLFGPERQAVPIIGPDGEVPRQTNPAGPEPETGAARDGGFVTATGPVAER